MLKNQGQKSSRKNHFSSKAINLHLVKILTKGINFKNVIIDFVVKHKLVINIAR